MYEKELAKIKGETMAELLRRLEGDFSSQIKIEILERYKKLEKIIDEHCDYDTCKLIECYNEADCHHGFCGDHCPCITDKEFKDVCEPDCEHCADDFRRDNDPVYRDCNHCTAYNLIADISCGYCKKPILSKCTKVNHSCVD